jgi:3-oxoadipate enol-lactonase
VLLAPAPPSPLIIPAEMKAQQMVAYSSAESSEFVVRNVLASSELADEDVKMPVVDIMKGNRFAVAAWPVYAILEDVMAEAKRIRLPVLVVAGQADRLEPVDRLSDEVVGNIQGAEMVIVEGVGHLLPVEAAREVAEFVREFVKRVF